MADGDVLRKSRGLGMLLSSIGGNKEAAPVAKTVIPQVSKVVTNESLGFNPNQAANFCGWGDVSSYSNEAAEDTASQPGPRRNSPHGRDSRDKNSAGMNNSQGKSGETSGRKDTKQFDDEDVYGQKDISRWADIKEYNEDHDSEWFAQENARLAKMYGGAFIYVKYLDSQPGRIGYYCELCSAEMNAKKSLGLHCGGMRHLKKKDQFEKGGREIAEKRSKPSDRDPLPSSQRPPRSAYEHPPPARTDRGDSRKDSYRDDRQPYRRPQSPYSRNDNRGSYASSDHYGRHPDNYTRDYYRQEPPPSYRQRSLDRDRYDARRTPPDVRRDEPRYDGRTASPDVRRDDPYQPGSMRRDPADRYQRERFNPYKRREAPPPPIISNLPASNPPPVPQPPVIRDVKQSAISFPGGNQQTDDSCNELLRNLASCRVKSKDDSVLACSVANFLVNSLREYYNKTGPPTIVHLLDEISVKFDIMSDLQK